MVYTAKFKTERGYTMFLNVMRVGHKDQAIAGVIASFIPNKGIVVTYTNR